MNISLYQAASALNANNRWQEVIAENMSAASVPGYKRQDVSFEAVQAGMMPIGSDGGISERQPWSMAQATTKTSFAPGEMRYTGQDTDVGISGNGFFEVQLPGGGLAYTRDGEFQMNSQGQLTTKQGYVVMGDSGAIQLDRATSDPIAVAADGTVSQGQVVRGKIKVVDFNKPELLTQASGGIFLAQNAGLQTNEVATPDLRQFFVEQANTTSMGEMANMITVMRSSEANQRIIQMEDERMGKAISELGNPN